jgi:hypothetical protein
VSRNRFSVDEDLRLLDLVAKHGQAAWNKVATEMGDRTGRQCRDRYKNYLSDRVVRAPWTPWEDEYIRCRYHEIGAHWATIAVELLTGRTPIQVTNRWNHDLSALSADSSGDGLFDDTRSIPSAIAEQPLPSAEQSPTVVDRIFGTGEHGLESEQIHFGDEDLDLARTGFYL